jgi:hypothetical protein
MMNLKKILLFIAFPLALASGSISESFAQITWPENYTRPGWVYQGMRARDYLIPKVAADSASLPTYPLQWTNGTRRDSSRGALAWTIAENKLYKWNGSAWSSVGGTTYTDANARAAISLTTTGTTGAATYSNVTGILNIPLYALSDSIAITRYGFGLNNIRSFNAGGTTSAAQNVGSSSSSSDSTNFLIGYNAGQTLTSGYRNVFLGNNAGQNVTTGFGNFAFGTNALKGNISFPLTGKNNFAIGTDALASLRSGMGGNVAIGEGAMPLLTTNGFDESWPSVAIGNRALYTLTTGGLLTAVGSNAGRQTNTGTRSTFVGGSSGYQFGAGQYNTTVGNEITINGGARFSASASNNTFIGALTAQGMTGGNNNTLIGYNTPLPVSNSGSDQISIGGKITKSTTEQYHIGPAIEYGSGATLTINGTAGGFLPPRLTTAQRDAISSPAPGLELFCTDCTATDGSTGVKQTYNGTTWKNHW